MKLRTCLAIGTAGLALLLTGCASTTAGQAVAGGPVVAVTAGTADTAGGSSSSADQNTDSGSGDVTPPSNSSDSGGDSSSSSSDSGGDSSSSSSSSDDSSSSDSSSSSSADDSVDTDIPTGAVPGMNAACLPVADAALDITQGKAGLDKVKTDLAGAGTLPASLKADFQTLEDVIGKAGAGDDIYTILGSDPNANKAYQDIADWLQKNCG